MIYIYCEFVKLFWFDIGIFNNMDVDSDSSTSSSDSHDEEFEKFKEDELKKKIDILENKVNFDY